MHNGVGRYFHNVFHVMKKIENAKLHFGRIQYVKSFLTEDHLIAVLLRFICIFRYTGASQIRMSWKS